MWDKQSFIVDINEENFHEVIQMSQEHAMVFSFFSQSQPQSVEFVQKLQQLAERHQGAFILVRVDCDTQPLIARQFQIQAIPTTYLFKDGTPLDAFPDVLSDEELNLRLANILPKEEEIKFNLALEYLKVEDYQGALPLLKEAWQLSDQKNSDIALLYAETYIALKNTEISKEILNQIPIQDRDSRWHGLQAQIDLLIQAADSPEIQQLQKEFAKTPTPAIAIRLAVQLHQAGRNEEALSLLLDFLKQDMNSADGEVKKEYLSIIAALGSDPVANKYRRIIYSLLY